MTTVQETTSIRPITNRQKLHKWWVSGLERESFLGYLLVTPMLLVVLGLIGYPFVLSIYFSLTDRVLGSATYEFVGLANYINLTSDPIFLQTLVNTFNYSVTAVIAKLFLGIVMALTLNEIVRFRRVIRAAFLLPWVAPSSLTILAWVWMFDSQYSIITYFLKQWGLFVGDKIPWLGEPALAMAAVQTVNIWRGVPFFGMIILAALVTVPKDLYEAAVVDGANAWARFRHVTLPHITPILGVVTLFSFVVTLGDFQIVWILTKGGPFNATHLIATLAFRTAIRGADLAKGSAMAAFLFPFLIVVIAAQLVYMRRR